MRAKQRLTEGRYSSHLLPVALVASAAGLEALLARVPARLGRVALLVALVGGLVAGLRPASEAYGWGVQNINVEQTCPDYLVIFPDWFPELAARRDLFRPVERFQKL